MTTTRRIPVNACQLRAGPLNLSAGESESEAAKPRRAAILARSGEGIDHWFWGRLVHDFSGLEQSKDRLPLDYCHDPEDLLGYAENWNSDSGDLTCTGILLPGQSERAAEVVALADQGVPYEASIAFEPVSVEYLDSGQMATVNGRQVDGPAAVVRRWRLVGLAVCPQGADHNTRTELSASAGEIEITVLTREKGMADHNQKLETPEEITARVQTELTNRVTDYTTRFGQHGQAWALSNRPLAECYADLVAQLRDGHATELAGQKTAHEAAIAELQGKLTAAEAKVTELDGRLATIGLGEKSPASTVPGDPRPEQTTELQAGLTPGLAKFVAAQRAKKAK